MATTASPSRLMRGSRVDTVVCSSLLEPLRVDVLMACETSHQEICFHRVCTWNVSCHWHTVVYQASLCVSLFQKWVPRWCGVGPLLEDVVSRQFLGAATNLVLGLGHGSD